MKVLRAACTLISLLGAPAVVAAGPIEFQLTPGTVTNYTPWAPALGMTLVPAVPPGTPSTFDMATGQPTSLPAVNYEPWQIPAPAARDIHPDGTTHWNNDGYFGVDVWLTDVASGQSADLQFGGRAHMYNTYSTAAGWGGVTYFWFLDSASVTLGGNQYTVWGVNHYDGGSATLDVWVGPNPPVHDSPEPGTLALAGLGLLPFGLRAIRRRQAVN